MKIAFFTLGCKVNQYESQAMAERMTKCGFETVSPNENADVYVINSCTVTAESDRKTVLNLTNHSYFNLTGFEELNVLDHKLKLYCSNFTPVDHTLIPTGEIRPVKGTAFDFTEEKTVGRDIEAKDLQLEYAGGYDHNYVIDRTQELSYRNTTLSKTAALTSPDDILSLEVSTDQPGVQVYCGNFLHDDIVFKGSKPQRTLSSDTSVSNVLSRKPLPAFSLMGHRLPRLSSYRFAQSFRCFPASVKIFLVLLVIFG